MGAVVRPATLADLIWLRLLYAQLHVERPLPYPRFDGAGDLEAFTANVAQRLALGDPAFCCLVAEDGPLVVGFLLGEVMTRQIGSPHRFGQVHWIYTVPQVRGQGVGRLLTHAAATFSQERGVEAVEICAAPDDPQWANRGWIPVAVTLALPLPSVFLSNTSRSPEPNGGTHPTPDQP